MARAPGSLDAPGRQAWHDARRTLIAIGEDPMLSRGALERYAAAVSMVVTLRAERRRLGSPGVMTGPRGAVSPHPLLRSIERAERQANAMAEALGLTPAGRRRLSRSVLGGRPPGAASARDRSAPPRLTAKVAPLRPRQSDDTVAS